MKTKTRPRTLKKCSFRQVTKVQVPNVEVLHVCRCESARHLPSQMLLGANADRTQALRHVVCIYEHMHHCTGLCI